MNAKAIPSPAAPGQADPPLGGSAASQVTMVVMLVPIATPTNGVPAAPAYVDSQDHVWLLVDKASPMAAVFEQISAAESYGVSTRDHQVAHNHSPWLDTSLSQPAYSDAAALGVESLSRRELDVLRLLADGQSNQEIAQVLILALNTVKMHIKHIYRKLGVRNRVQAVAQAHVLGMFSTTMH